MLGGLSWQELLVLAGIILLLSGFGVWPQVIRGIRQLRGETIGECQPPPPAPDETAISLCCQMLGISPSASWQEIERAYRAKARIHHPDHGGDGDTMRALNEAYALLKRSRLRHTHSQRVS